MSNAHGIPWTRTMITAIAALVIGIAGAGPQVEEAGELLIKATWVTKIGSYVTWPNDAFTDANAPFVIGVIGDDPIGDIIERAGKGRNVRGRSIRVVRIATLHAEEDEPDRLEGFDREIRPCHLLFVCRSERRRLDELLDVCSSRPILTVSDLRHFARDGGMVEFVPVRDKLGFHINRTAYQKSRLALGGDFLNIAKKIYDEKK